MELKVVFIVGVFGILEMFLFESGSMKENEFCSCRISAYAKYDDYLPIYDTIEGQLIAKFRFEDLEWFDFGKQLSFSAGMENWLKINDDFVANNGIMIKGKWVQSEYVEIGTTNYDGSYITIYSEPNYESDSIGYISKESYLKVLNCNGDWIKVNAIGKGWLAKEFQCDNDVTNCD